jgi:predicted enzyme related to lactoylglutathione lyase
MPSGGNSTIVYFICEDCAVEARAAVEHGGKIFKDKFSIGEFGWIALVYDTEGNMIGLHSME